LIYQFELNERHTWSTNFN